MRKVDAPLAWGFERDGGKLFNLADSERPRKTKGGYTSAFHALGYKPVRVRVVRDEDYLRLLRRAQGKP